MDTLNVYRRKVLALSPSRRGNLMLTVATLPPIRRDQIVLPDGVLKRIEGRTLGFAERVDALRAAGRHLKRGLLLHGPPGTGKTLTAMYRSRTSISSPLSAPRCPVDQPLELPYPMMKAAHGSPSSTAKASTPASSNRGASSTEPVGRARRSSPSCFAAPCASHPIAHDGALHVTDRELHRADHRVGRLRDPRGGF